ncbi:MAG: hypothetical protein CSA35_01355 [Dethiosulfovibrio peptidovorans]|nr:MAG: hypothetical protein CSA35_01355 [Dethiosulfovibrio peptidovorans]
MPHLVVVSAAESSQRRLLLDTLKNHRDRGYELFGRIEGGRWIDLFADAMTGGLFASRTVRVVEDAESMGAFPRELLPSLEGNDADSVFILVYGKRRSYLPREVLSRCTVLEAETVPFWPSKRADWLRQKAQNAGIDLKGDGASLLVDWVEEPEELLSTLDFLGQFVQDGPVDRRIVEMLVVNQQGRGMLKLLDGVSSRRAGICLEGLVELRAEGELIPTLAALHKRLRFALYMSIIPSGAAKALSMTAYQARQARDAAGRYARRELADFLAGIIGLSLAERTGDGQGWSGLERLVLHSL